jgi:ATP adenylyltransferase
MGSAAVLNRIWAPWRAQYVQTAADCDATVPGCFLCEGLNGSRDRENLLVFRGTHSFVILNRYPYNNGHLLVAPRVHKGRLGELHGGELTEPVKTVRMMMGILDRLLRPQGYNVGLNEGKSAGAGLPGHLHWHVVPRWDGDTNFMPILADNKVIIESLHELYDRLVEAMGQSRPEQG